jgi:hypothetical protein
MKLDGGVRRVEDLLLEIVKARAGRCPERRAVRGARTVDRGGPPAVGGARAGCDLGPDQSLH